jgi:hypothetical protein
MIYFSFFWAASRQKFFQRGAVSVELRTPQNIFPRGT